MTFPKDEMSQEKKIERAKTLIDELEGLELTEDELAQVAGGRIPPIVDDPPFGRDGKRISYRGGD